MKRHFLFLTLLCLLLLCPAVHAETVYDGTLRISEGTLLPMLNFTDGNDASYTNEGSDILRFVVYVETDYDTDGDGKLDLVKTFVQVPRGAAEGKYKAASVFDPTPYTAGTIQHYSDHSEGMYTDAPFDYATLYSQPEKRVPAGETDTLSHARVADPADWLYSIPRTGEQISLIMSWYNYYLVRGYAVIQASGIGTYGSEGFELCAMDLERDAMKNVVEWLAGDRVAYTDRENSIAICADWSNGNVAMTGGSYGGTLPYEVATTGVKGLKTIIPYAGIASWYDYTNSQGIPTRTDVHYTDNLAIFNAGGTFLDDGWTVPNETYGAYLWQIVQDQEDSNGDYTPIWAHSDYSKDWEKIDCSALIVHGLNDLNVTVRQSDLMMQAFAKAGKTAKLILHQGHHTNLYNWLVNGENWYEIQNRWLAHYLYDVANDAENMPVVFAQSNIDGQFHAYDSWQDFSYTEFPVISNGPESMISTDGLAEVSATYLNQVTAEENIDLIGTRENFYFSLDGTLSAIYDVEVPGNTTIYGVPQIRLKARTNTTDKDGLMISAILIDVEDNNKPFKAYNLSRVLEDGIAMKTVRKVDFGDGLGKTPLKEPVMSSTAAKAVTFGWTDLCNPGCGPDSSEYTTSTALDASTAYDYTFYMIPTVYTLLPGHTLKLVLTTWDPNCCFLDEAYQLDPDNVSERTKYHYEYFVDNSSIQALIPTR